MGEQRSKAKAVKWYAQRRNLYEALSEKAAATLEELIRLEGINCHNVTWRAKTIASFEEKIARKPYRDPSKQATDLAGIRVVCYVESEVKRVETVVRNAFKIDEQNTLHKREELGVDRVGYQSLHLVAEFAGTRLNLPEYQRFRGIRFEVQVRTILQHAWAEIEHDRNYKFRGVLPDPIRRRFALLAGSLETADREFDQISSEIDRYVADVKRQTASGELEASVNTTSVKEFLNTRLGEFIEKGLSPSFGGGEGAEAVIGELHAFGVSTLANLEQLLEGQLGAEDEEYLIESNFIGVLRDLMIITDWERYFENAWGRNWQGTDRSSLEFWSDRGVPARDLIVRYGLDVLE